MCYGAVTSMPALPECPDTDAVTVAEPAVSPAVTVKDAEVELAGTVTEPGTVATPLSDETRLMMRSDG